MYASQAPTSHLHATHVVHTLLPGPPRETEAAPAWFTFFEERTAIRLNGLMEKLQDIEETVDNIESRLEAVESKVNEVDTAVNDISTAELEESVDILRVGLSRTRAMAAKEWNLRAGDGSVMQYEIVPREDGELPTGLFRLPALRNAVGIQSLTEEQVRQYVCFYEDRHVWTNPPHNREPGPQTLPIAVVKANLCSFIGCSVNVQ